ncbi:MAG TPA: hypothetical protein VM889_06805 [Candidatus Thermoplasmatota archaeon]|nr:hypothetical protein [Candidatus Thermoplasmatota archaeon]
MANRILIALLVAASTALAGCLQADNGGAGGKNDGNGDGAGPDQPIPTTGEARTLLAASSGEDAFGKLDRVGLKGNFSSDEGRGDFQFAHIKGDGAWLFRVKISQGATTFSLGSAQKGTTGNFYWGEKTYVTRDEVPETGSVFEAIENFSRQNPYGGSGGDDEGASTDSFLGGEMEGYIVDSVTPTTHKGKGAFVVKAHNETNTVEATFYLDRRPAAFTFTTMEDGKRQTGAFEILYGSEVAIDVSTTGERTSFSLVQESEDASTETQKITRGVVADGHREEVKLGEIEMRAIYQDGEPGRFGEPGPGTVLASMKLNEGTKTVNGHTFTYTDVDGDGLVSAGDTYEFTSDDMEAVLMFYDTWADMYEGKPNIPFPGALALLAILGVAAFLARRRA